MGYKVTITRNGMSFLSTHCINERLFVTALYHTLLAKFPVDEGYDITVFYSQAGAVDVTKQISESK